MGARGREYVHTHFDRAALADEMLSVMISLMDDD